MLRSLGILGIITIALPSGQALAAPTDATKALRLADRAAASVSAKWTKFDPSSKAYTDALDAIERSRAFATPIVMSVTDISLETDGETGTTVLTGICRDRYMTLDYYRSADEHLYKKTFNKYTNQIQTDFDREMDRLESTHSVTMGAQGGGQVILTQASDPEGFAAHIARRKLEHATAMKDRIELRDILFGDLDMISESRRKKLGPITIHATIKPELRKSRRFKKASLMKSATLTVEIDSFALKAGNKEIGFPVSVGSLTGRVIEISPYNRNAKKIR